MGESRITLRELQTVLLEAVGQVKSTLQRVEKNEEAIGNLWKKEGIQDVNIAKAQQWIIDHEKREIWLFSIATIIVGILIFVANYVFR